MINQIKYKNGIIMYNDKLLLEYIIVVLHGLFV